MFCGSVAETLHEVVKVIALSAVHEHALHMGGFLRAHLLAVDEARVLDLPGHEGCGLLRAHPLTEPRLPQPEHQTEHLVRAKGTTVGVVPAGHADESVVLVLGTLHLAGGHDDRPRRFGELERCRKPVAAAHDEEAARIDDEPDEHEL